MREYETTFIVQPEISEEGSKSILERLAAVLEKNGDIRLTCEDLGKRRLAYEIKKFHKGHYYILTYLGLGKSVPELERSLRLDESVLRFMTVQSKDWVTDIEARKAEAVEFERDQEKRAAERAAREAEEARAREEAERLQAEEDLESDGADEEDEDEDSDLGESDDLDEDLEDRPRRRADEGDES